MIIWANSISIECKVQKSKNWYNGNDGVVSLKEEKRIYSQERLIKIELIYSNLYIYSIVNTIDSLSKFNTILQIKLISGSFRAAKKEFWKSLDRFEKVSIIDPDGLTISNIYGQWRLI